MTTSELTTLKAVLGALFSRPYDLLVRRWNWKSALLSSIIRALIFLAANLGAGRKAALAAMATEFTYRALTSGFFASLTQAFRYVKPEWQGTLAAVLLLPLVSHSLELCVHLLRGTPRLAVSIAASATFTAISTSYNLFAMRKGALIVDADGRPFMEDLRRTPAIIWQFVISGFWACRQLIKRAGIFHSGSGISAEESEF